MKKERASTRLVGGDVRASIGDRTACEAGEQITSCGGGEDGI